MSASHTEYTDLVKSWPKLKSIVSVPHTKEQYNRMVRFLDHLIDLVGDNADHPLASLMETIGTLIEVYEEKNLPQRESDPVTALKYLMDEHHLKQGDLTEIGSQGVVSEILSGKRLLNTRQIRALAHRFNVSPAVFI